MDKQCSKCGITKNIEEFNKHTQNGRRPECILCQRKWHKEYRKQNLEKYKEKRRKEYIKNIEAQRAYYKQPLLVYKSYIKGAKRRKLEFKISFEFFCNSINKNCFYCEEKANGIDRLDSSKGYIEENCVPCCTICNRMKSNYTLDYFLSKCKKIVETNANKKVNKSPQP